MELELTADEAAVNVTCCGVPGVRVMLLGATVTPKGTPATWTLTWEENPSMPVADTLTIACEPALTDCMLGFTDKVKLGLEDGPDPPPLPPQPVNIRVEANIAAVISEGT